MPAIECEQCGESWLEDAIVARIETMVADAKKRGAQVEVVTMAA
jgi:peptide subunit release factor 1 (eRF1)